MVLRPGAVSEARTRDCLLAFAYVNVQIYIYVTLRGIKWLREGSVPPKKEPPRVVSGEA